MEHPSAQPSWVERLLEAIAVICLFLLMCVVVIDVSGRNLLNSPLPWGSELLQTVLGVMLFCLYPLLAFRGNHITVDLIPVSESVRVVQKIIASIVGVLLFSVIGYCVGWQAIRSGMYGDVSPLLQIPTADLLWMMSALSAVTVAGFLVYAARVVRLRLNRRQAVRVANLEEMKC